MVQQATKVVETISENPSDTADTPDMENVDDFMDAVFINDDLPPRIRKLCQKYYGDEWDNS